ncbi:MAG: aminotransferase class I/II-fold pyridoxal phosphate-dependent enzyme, partial [Vicinamibacterales bacterium]
MTLRRAIRHAIARLIPGADPAVTPLPPMYPGGMRIGSEEEAAVREVVRQQRLFRYYGPESGPSRVDAFEAAFRETMGGGHCVAVSSGTSALFAGLAALGVGPGDEVIVPAYTWISSAAAIVAAGAVPVIAEIDSSLTLDPDDVERRVSPYTKAIMAVHMRGAPCRMDRLMDIARRHRLSVIEDVAQAAGGSFRGQRLGNIGDIGAFSFQYNKLLTAGEGGMVVTGDHHLHQRVLLFHDVAAAQRNQIPRAGELPGLTLRMSELHGAVLGVQLGRLEGLLATWQN